MSELSIVVGLRAKTGQEDELRRDLTELVEPSRKEVGNVRYELFEDQTESGLFVFVEEWSSPEARAEHHERSSHIQHFHANGAKNIGGKVFAHVLKRLG